VFLLGIEGEAFAVSWHEYNVVIKVHYKRNYERWQHLEQE